MTSACSANESPEPAAREVPVPASPTIAASANRFGDFDLKRTHVKRKLCLTVTSATTAVNGVNYGVFYGETERGIVFVEILHWGGGRSTKSQEFGS